MRTVTLIEAPTSAGAYAPGQEDGPRALLDAGLVEGLEAKGITVHLRGRTSMFRWRPDPENRRAANAVAVVERASQVASLIRAAPEADTILVLGGDCTVGVGTVAGLLDSSSQLGLVYVDRHADLNVPESTTDGALDWMGVAHMLDVEGSVAGLAALGRQRPMLSAAQVSFLGLGLQTEFENQVLTKRQLPVVDVATAASDPLRAARTAISPLVSCDSLAVHFDVDLVDFLDAPLAENTDRGAAASLEACGQMLSALFQDDRVRALTVTEFNPYHGAPNGDTARRLVQVLINALSELPPRSSGIGAQRSTELTDRMPASSE